MATYAYGDQPPRLVAAREVSPDASSLAMGMDGTLWVGRSSGRVQPAGALTRELGTDIDIRPSKLRVERHGRFGALLVSDVLSQSDDMGLYVLPLRTKRPATPRRLSVDYTDFGFFPSGNDLWMLNGEGTLRTAKISRSGALSASRVFDLKGFNAAVGTEIGATKLLVASYAGQIREVRLLQNRRARLGRPAQSSGTIDKQSRYYGNSTTSVLLVTSNGVVEHVRLTKSSPRVVKLLDVREPVVSDVLGSRN